MTGSKLSSSMHQDLDRQGKNIEPDTKLQVIPLGWACRRWTVRSVLQALRDHPLLVVLCFNFLVFMKVEYGLPMVKPGHEPLDLGFLFTAPVYRFLEDNLALHHFLAALNTLFVFFQVGYIASTFVLEGRRRACIACLLLYTSRGILGSTTRLPVPKEFIASVVDFPVGSVSFFFFFSGHVAGAVIASLDLKRMKRRRMAFIVDALNFLQCIRMLGSRGHYTIDLIIGAVAGWVCDLLAALYEVRKKTLKGAREYKLLFGDEIYTIVQSSS